MLAHDNKKKVLDNLKLETRNSNLFPLAIDVAQTKLAPPSQLLGIAVLAIAFMGADVDARFNKLGHQLMCMCGCNQVLLECNHVGCAYSERMRRRADGVAGARRQRFAGAAELRAEVRQHGAVGADDDRLQLVAWIMPFAVFAAASALTLWLVRLWKSRPVAQPVAHPNLESDELDALRKKARQETEF